MICCQSRKITISRFESLALAVIGGYLILSYVLLPLFWRLREPNPKIDLEPKTSFKSDGVPGDPLNVGLAGTTIEVFNALTSAGWYLAAKPNLGTIAKEVESIIARRKYFSAPVSSLYLWGRKQDIAFEQLDGKSPRRRHHVRFWLSNEPAPDGRPLWLGAATFDRNIGLSRLTGQFTHHISPDIDSERDKLVEDIKNSGKLAGVYTIKGVGPTLGGVNGEGDKYFTDGLLKMVVLKKE